MTAVITHFCNQLLIIFIDDSIPFATNMGKQRCPTSVSWNIPSNERCLLDTQAQAYMLQGCVLDYLPYLLFIDEYLISTSQMLRSLGPLVSCWVSARTSEDHGIRCPCKRTQSPPLDLVRQWFIHGEHTYRQSQTVGTFNWNWLETGMYKNIINYASNSNMHAISRECQVDGLHHGLLWLI